MIRAYFNNHLLHKIMHIIRENLDNQVLCKIFKSIIMIQNNDTKMLQDYKNKQVSCGLK